MFSGIVEATAPLIRSQKFNDVLQIIVQKPESFDDLSSGDSIAVNGVCLTVEKFSDTEIQFALGAETLKVTGWSAESLSQKPLNLERSLRWGDRIHGHLVSGHVDNIAQVAVLEKGDSWIVGFSGPFDRRYVWAKGSITLNGVGLTVNKINDSSLEICLIPETLLRTNLKNLQPGDSVNVEYDSWAKAFINYQEQKEAAP